LSYPITLSTATGRESRIESIEQEINLHKQAISDEFIQLGRLLWEVHHNKLYLERGLNSFEDWLDSPDVDMSRTLGYDLIRLTNLIASGFPAHGVVEIGVSKARLLLPILENQPDDTAEWIAKAQTLSWRDLRREVRGDDDYEDARYSGRGMLTEVVKDMKNYPELWEHEVQVRVRTL